MSSRVNVHAVEGNDIWLVWRVTKPDGGNLVRGDMKTGSDALNVVQMTVSLIHESSLGNSKNVIRLFQGSADPGAILAGTSTLGAAGDPIGTNDFLVFSSLETTLWGGLDDLGYTIEARIRSDGANYSEADPEIAIPSYILEGGNKYAVEVNLASTKWGTITVAAQLQIDYLHSV